MKELLDIGQVAGEIPLYLQENSNAVTTFKLRIILSLDLVSLHLALGWLLRENKIYLEPFENGYNVILN